MRVVITGPGRGGTNWVTEVVRASGVFNFTKQVEDRKLFLRNDTLPDNYGTKLSTENEGVNVKNLSTLMNLYDDLYIIFTFRNPVANCMAKIYRGRPSSVGGDGSNIVSADGTVDTAIKAVSYSYKVYTKMKSLYLSRVHIVKLEDLILHNKEAVDGICNFLSISSNNDMYNAHKNNRNVYQKKRYGDKVDTTQVYLHKNWETAYDGFFKNRNKQIVKLNKSLISISNGLGYDSIY